MIIDRFHFVILLIVLIISTSEIYSQSIPDSLSSPLHTFSRTRILVGITSLQPDNTDVNFSHPFLNINYRSSSLGSFSRTFKANFAFEPGVNFLFITEQTGNEIIPFVVPYAKVSPEIYLGNNILLSLSGGLSFLLLFQSEFYPFPFAGLNCFYLIDFSEKVYLEFECGFHTTFTNGTTAPYLFYFDVGLAIK